MVNRLEDLVSSMSSTTEFSNDIKFYSDREIKELLITDESQLIENYVSQEEIQIEISNKVVDDHNKICLALVIYKKLSTNIHDALELKNFLYSVEVLIQYFIKKYFPDEVDTLKTFFELEIRKVIFLFKETIIFCEKIDIEVKLSMLEDVLFWVKKNDDNILYEKSHKELINNIKIILEYIESITISISRSKYSNCSSVVKKIRNKINNVLLSNLLNSVKTHDFLINLINISDLEIELKETLKNIINEISLCTQYPRSTNLLQYIEKLFPDYFQFKFIYLEEAKKLISSFYDLYDDFIMSEVKPEYLSTDIHQEPSKDLLLILLISTVIDNYEVLYLHMKKSFTMKQELAKVFSLEVLVKNLEKMPKNQAVILDMLLQGMISDSYKTFDLITLRFLHSEPILQELDSDFKREFLKQALSNPFKKILNQFLPTNSQGIEITLEEMLRKTYITHLPSNLSGITLIRKVVLIQEYPDGICKKPSTFYVLLHEAAHFLQRVNCKFLNDSNKPFSSDLSIELDACEDLDGDYSCWTNKIIMETLSMVKEAGKKIVDKVKSGNEELKNQETDEKQKKSDDIEYKITQEIKNQENRKSREIKSERKQIKKKKIEGGKLLEISLFGKQYEIITADAAEFLMSDLTGYSLPKFRCIFNELNNKDRSAEYQMLRSSEGIYLGSCPGFGYFPSFRSKMT